MKKYCYWNQNGEPQIVESNAEKAEVTKTKTGLRIRIGKIKIKNAVGFTEISDGIQVK